MTGEVKIGLRVALREKHEEHEGWRLLTCNQVANPVLKRVASKALVRSGRDDRIGDEK